MKAETKRARIAALLGLEVPKPPTKEEIEAAGTISREAEAVALFLDNPKRFIQRECKNCGGVFAVNRGSISLCTDTCRQHWLETQFGLIWDPKARSLEERWSAQTGGPEPLIVPPTVLPLAQESLDRKESQTVPMEEALSESELDSLLDLSGLADL